MTDENVVNLPPRQARAPRRRAVPREIHWPETTRTGEVIGRSQPNVHAYLAYAGITLSHNAFTVETLVTRDGVTVALSDELMVNMWLEADRLGLKTRDSYFEKVIEDTARKHSFHPVRDYLDALPPWDGTPRLDHYLQTHFKAEASGLISFYGRVHLIAGVRRVRQPGCKYDCCLILQGPQGGGKSSGIAALCPDLDYFTDSLAPGDDQKVTIEQTQGKWLCEFAELNGMRKREVETIKAMISRQVDRARMSYGRRAVQRQRQFILWGSVNPRTYLRDQSGNRRFLPVPVGEDLDRDEIVASIVRDRDQLWAEAAHYEATGESLALPRHLREEANESQEAALIVHPWEETLAPALDLAGRLKKSDGKAPVAIKKDLIWHRLGVATDKLTPTLSETLNEIMDRLGFHSGRRREPQKEASGDGELVMCFVHKSVKKGGKVDEWLDPWVSWRPPNSKPGG